jgi:hypothetical protein
MICRDAAEAISRSFDAPLPRVTHLGLAVHTLLCGHCRQFRRQMIRLHAECVAVSRGEPPPGTAGLSPAARERIAAALDNPPTR